MLKAMELADYVIRYCTEMGQPISNLQLQKILYFLQSVYCRATGELLFEEPFEAWPYGPVLREVYNKYSEYGGRAIEDHTKCSLPVSQEVLDFINDGIDILRRQSPWDLVKTSHAPGSPWDLIYRNGKGYKHEIPNDLIKKASLNNGAELG